MMLEADRTKKPAAVVAQVIRGRAEVTEKRFTSGFTVGRTRDCDLQITENCVSRNHLKVDIEEWQCILRDIGSSNGTFVNGERVLEYNLSDRTEVELGKGGALLLLTVEWETIPAPVEEPAPAQDFTTETQIIRHYFDKKVDGEVGEQTMMFQRAFHRVQKKKSRKYQVAIAVALIFLLIAGGVIFYQTQKIKRLRQTASNIFYSMKGLELQISKLEEVVLLKADPQQVAELTAKRQKLKEMEKDYDSFVNELGVYKNAAEDERIILHVARIFGECDASAPKGFIDEVRRYIKGWQKTDRLKTALDVAKEKGYAHWIIRILGDNNLPPEYFFLALQESNFDERAVGPETRYGYAKGMWQFIALTAMRYGLQIGPLQKQAAYDPMDERFNFIKATAAAAKYIKEISDSEAQASGLLVMASYNWGENSIRQIIQKMPETPRERNFWRLLGQKNVPQETYDYVFSIVSATAICENPTLFGFENLSCPEMRHSADQQGTEK